MKTIRLFLIITVIISSKNISSQTFNVALNKTGTFSQNNTTVALQSSIIDGNTTTLALTFAGYQNNPTFFIDLAAKYDLINIGFTWGSINKPLQYTVWTSSDNVNWSASLIVSNNTNSADLRQLVIPNVRYLKIGSIYRVSPYTIDLYDIQINGSISCIADGGFKKLCVNDDATFNSLINAQNINITGKVGIGCTSQTVELAVNGKIQAKEIEITTTPCSDFVFEKSYKLMNLNDLGKFVTVHKHLPEIPSAIEFKEKGMNISEMNDILLRKVEELTLYIIDLDKQLQEAKSEIEKLNAGK
jgi:hypothetical protein